MLELDPVKTVFSLLLSFNFCVSTSLISSNLQDPSQELGVGRVRGSVL